MRSTFMNLRRPEQAESLAGLVKDADVFIESFSGRSVAALRRRAKEGGSYHVRVSLTRAAMWYQSLGTIASTDFDATKPEHRMTAPEALKAQTSYGEIHRLAPQAKLSRTPGRWRDPLLIVRGSDLPEWQQ